MEVEFTVLFDALNEHVHAAEERRIELTTQLQQQRYFEWKRLKA